MVAKPMFPILDVDNYLFYSLAFSDNLFPDVEVRARGNNHWNHMFIISLRNKSLWVYCLILCPLHM